jgi:hypothetical protein
MYFCPDKVETLFYMSTCFKEAGKNEEQIEMDFLKTQEVTVRLIVQAMLLVTVMGWYRTKHPMLLQPFSDLLCSSSDFRSFPIH